MVNPTPLVPTKNIDRSVIPAIDKLQSLALAIASDAMVALVTIDNENYLKSFIQVNCTHASKDLTYNVYGHVAENGGVAPDFSTTTWKKIITNDVTVIHGTVDIQNITDAYRWLVVVFERAVAGGGNDSTADFFMRALRA